jgi:hypothetical protein
MRTAAVIIPVKISAFLAGRCAHSIVKQSGAGDVTTFFGIDADAVTDLNKAGYLHF